MRIEEGTVVSVFAERATVKVQKEQSGVLSDELPVIFRGTLKNKEFSMPSIGEQVVCIFGTGSVGYVLGAIFSEVDMPPITESHKHYFHFEDGASFEYDTKTHELNVTCETINVTGNINCSGTIISGGGLDG
ncbi:MAG: phage baseplate assembly protein V [Sporosarcina sp.]